MTDEEKIARLTALYVSEGDRLTTTEEAETFLVLYREMQTIDREEAEDAKVQHARDMSRPKR